MKKPSLKIVFNATSLRPGGGLTVLLGVLQGLNRQDSIALDAIVICSSKETADAIQDQGIASKVYLRCQNQSVLRRQWWVMMSMGKLVNSINPDLFFSVNQFVGGVRSPQIVYHLNLLRFLPIDRTKGWGHRFAEWIRNRGALAALKKADANVFESHYLQECASKVFSRKNGVDKVIYIGLPDQLIDSHVALDTHASATDERSTGKPSSCLLAITNHNEHKDNPTLLRILHTLVNQHSHVDWRLKIAGSIFPEKWKPHKDLARELGVDDRIEWLGFVSQDELTEHLRSSLCLVSTSRIESFCMVALESMARGCPAVVANASSMPESVGDAAVLVAPGDHEGFAEAIATFQAEPDVRNDFVQFGFERVSEFRWDRCGAEFADLMLDLIERN